MGNILAIISTGTKGLYRKVATRLGNGYYSTQGMTGPVVANVSPKIRYTGGLEKISFKDRFFRDFSVSNPNIASTSERWYGTDIEQRFMLGNAADRHRCLVDMSRNNNGGLFRAVFDEYSNLKKTISFAKDGSFVSKIYRLACCGESSVLRYFAKKVVRGADGCKLREVYTVKSAANPKEFYTFVVDAQKGLKQTIGFPEGICTFKQGDITETFMRNSQGKVRLDMGTAAGIDANLKSSFDALQKQDWMSFLKSKVK